MHFEEAILSGVGEIQKEISEAARFSTVKAENQGKGLIEKVFWIERT